MAPFVAPIDDRREQIGGAQVVLLELTRALAARGHAVTLAAADGSHVDRVRVAALGIDAGALQPADLLASGARRDEAAQRDAFARVRAWLDAHASEIDVVHAHAYDAPAFDALRGATRPVVHTLHLPPNDESVVAAARAARDATLVTVSEANARAWRDRGVKVDGVMHNGVDLARIPLSRDRGDHLLYAGRLSPEKGVEVALDTAERLGRGLVLVGGVYDEAYHPRAVAPRVRAVTALPQGQVRGALWLGRRPPVDVYALMGSAAATLMPVRWDEPFGLVGVESLAAGTPVVAYARGGLTEIIDDTVGALVPPDDLAAFAAATERVIGIDPLRCRARAERFDLPAMVERYEALYARLV